MMQDDPIAVYRIAGGGHGLVHGRGPCDERAAAGQWTDPSCAKMASGRSEEHTSELQSLMRISYAVFCLKKKKQTSELQSLMRLTYDFLFMHKTIKFKLHNIYT